MHQGNPCSQKATWSPNTNRGPIPNTIANNRKNIRGWLSISEMVSKAMEREWIWHPGTVPVQEGQISFFQKDWGWEALITHDSCYSQQYVAPLSLPMETKKAQYAPILWQFWKSVGSKDHLMGTNKFVDVGSLQYLSNPWLYNPHHWCMKHMTMPLYFGNFNTRTGWKVLWETNKFMDVHPKKEK